MLGQDVLVGLDGERRGGVTEPFADDFDGDAGVDEQRGVGVSEVVKPDDRNVGAADESVEGLGELVGVDGPAVAVGEHPVGDAGADGERVRLRCHCCHAREHVDGGGVELDAAAGVGGLAA